MEKVRLVSGIRFREQPKSVESCDICYRPFKTGDLVFDVPTKAGRWGNLCRACNKHFGTGTSHLGTAHLIP